MKASIVKIYPVSNQDFSPVNDAEFNSRIACWSNGPLELPPNATHFGFVNSGRASVETESGKFDFMTGMYFSIPGPASICGTGTGFIASRPNWNGFFQIGGPIEQQGRLTYIDGCSDSLLIAPVTLGDPCLNFLYLPPHTTQTAHTHPSCRIGIIADGTGVCRTPDHEFPLHPGLVFEIDADAQHSFHTESESLKVIAWHPDSDFGPTHGDHPMINRTMINGTSAASLRHHEENAQ